MEKEILFSYQHLSDSEKKNVFDECAVNVIKDLFDDTRVNMVKYIFHDENAQKKSDNTMVLIQKPEWL